MCITRKSLVSLATAAVLMLLTVCAHAADYYVDGTTGNDNNTGQSAATAFQTIQAAIDAAAPGDTIIVAAGTYRESLSWTTKDLTIQGAGVGRSIIDPSAASGGPGGRCLSTWYRTAASKIEGFTFQGGQADPGAGMYNAYSSPTVVNCAFTGNSAGSSGYAGGMFNTAFSSPTITNCTFTGNQALEGGAMYNYDNSNPMLTNCTFTGNFVWWYGAAVRNYAYSNPTLTNCTITSNTAIYAGGGIYNEYSSPTLTNCILWGNAGGGMDNHYYNNYPTLSHTDSQNFANAAPDGNGNFNADPRFVDAANGDLHLLSNSPCINRGDDAVVTAPPFPADSNGTPLDLDGNSRLHSLHVDLGAYEYQGQDPNQAPVANAGNDQIVPIAHDGNLSTNTASVTLDGTGSSDPDGDSLTYAWDDGNGHSATGEKPTLNLTAGTYTFTLTVTDPSGATGTDTVSITVTAETNQTPSASASSNAPVTVPHDGSPATNTGSITLNGTASSDPDGDSLAYQWKEGNTVLGSTATLQVSKPAGDYTFTLVVTDPYGASSSASVSVHVNPEPNGAPRLSVPSSVQVDAGCPVTLIASATDPDNDSVAYSLVSPPAWASINSSTGVVTLAPPARMSGNFTLTVKATDPYGASATKSVSVSVCPVIIESASLSKKNGVVTVQFTLRNTSATMTVSNVSLNSATLKGIATTTALPIAYGQLKAGVVKSVQLKFSAVPSGSAPFIVSGTSSAGPVCANLTVTVP